MDIVELELRRAEHWQQREALSVVDVSAKLRLADLLSEREERFAAQLQRQEGLLFSALHLLLNMAEDAVVEQKMVRKGLLAQLATLLDRSSPNLLVLLTTFLRKLSVYAEAKRAMLDAGVVHRLVALVPSDGGELLRSVLRLLHNLSFDAEQRLEMVSAGLIPRAVGLLAQPEPIRQLALGLLYHLSLEDKHRSMFLYTDALPRLHQLLMEVSFGLAVLAPELVALVANLTESARVAEEMARAGSVEPLVQRALEAQDEPLWEVVHNMARHDSEVVRQRLAPSLAGMAQLLMVGASATLPSSPCSMPTLPSCPN